MCLLAFVLLGCQPKVSQQAKDAVLELRKVEAKTQVGVNTNDYLAALAAAKLAVNLYLASPAAKDDPTLSDAIKKTMKDYQSAASIWSIAAETVGDFPASSLLLDDPRAQNMIADYPSLNAVMKGELAWAQLQNLLYQVGMQEAGDHPVFLNAARGDGAVFFAPFTGGPGVRRKFGQDMAKIDVRIAMLKPKIDRSAPFSTLFQDGKKYLSLMVALRLVYLQASDDLAVASRIIEEKSH